jgi:arsenate reductase
MISTTPKLQKKIKIALQREISKERKEILQVLIDYIQKKRAENKEPLLNFICTHNSRRSQFSQIWAYTAAGYYNIKIKCYSGGVEVTAFNTRAVNSIKRSGFIVTSTEGSNPYYQVTYNHDATPLVLFSKLFDHPENPSVDFAAVMTCAHADENCPIIPGAEERISLQYDDPKAFDSTPLETEKYDERSLQIASELLYVFKSVGE